MEGQITELISTFVSHVESLETKVHALETEVNKLKRASEKRKSRFFYNKRKQQRNKNKTSAQIAKEKYEQKTDRLPSSLSLSQMQYEDKLFEQMMDALVGEETLSTPNPFSTFDDDDLMNLNFKFNDFHPRATQLITAEKVSDCSSILTKAIEVASSTDLPLKTIVVRNNLSKQQKLELPYAVRNSKNLIIKVNLGNHPYDEHKKESWLSTVLTPLSFYDPTSSIHLPVPSTFPLTQIVRQNQTSSIRAQVYHQCNKIFNQLPGKQKQKVMSQRTGFYEPPYFGPSIENQQEEDYPEGSTRSNSPEPDNIPSQSSSSSQIKSSTFFSRLLHKNH